MIKQSQSRPSTAPIALLLTAGFLCLALSATFPTRTETRSPVAPAAVAAEPIRFVVTSSIDPASTAIAIGLLTVAVIAFAAAGRLIYRRHRQQHRG